MLKYEDALPGQRDLAAVRTLYESAFPEDERMAFDRLTGMQDALHRMLVWYDGETLAGITFTFQHEGLTYLSYLAVDGRLRGKGYGSQILQVLKRMYPRIVIDIERIRKETDTEQIRRKRFYERAGFRETGVFYYIWYVDYELLCTGRTVTAEEWDRLIHAFWGTFADTAVIETDLSGTGKTL